MSASSGSLRGAQDEISTSRGCSGRPARFDQHYAELSRQVKAGVTQPAPTAVAQVFMGYWGDFTGLSVTGTFGPEPVTAGQLAQLTALHPAVVIDNAYQPANLDIPGARTVELINFPGPDLNLLSVFDENSRRLTAAVKG
ncbi:MAG TPA: hypothetical protein VGJ13_07490 [Pseudonocardiaceae bacterium]